MIVASGVTIYEGTLVSKDASGYAIAAEPDYECVGIAADTRTAGQPLTVRSGHVVQLNFASIAQSNIGDIVYASDNQTATTTPNTALLGRIAGVDTVNDKAFVWLTLGAGASKLTQTNLVINLSGVTGDNVTEALDALEGLIPSGSDDILNESDVAGTTTSDALDNLEDAIPTNVAGHQSVPPYAYSTEGGSATVIVNASQYTNGSVYNKDENNGDFIEYRVLLDAGTWTLRTLYITDSDGGYGSISLNGTPQGSNVQFYTAAPVYNNIVNRTLTITTAGWYTIQYRILGKEAGSSSYKYYISGLSVWKNA